MNKLSTYLYAAPSFVEGIARLVDFCGALDQYNSSTTSSKADSNAIASDWKVVGNDFSRVIKAHNIKKPLDDSLILEAHTKMIKGKKLTKPNR